MIETFPSRTQFLNNAPARVLLDWLESTSLSETGSALVYLGFPLYRDDEGGLIRPDVLLISQHHGVIGFALLASTSDSGEKSRCLEIQDQVPSFIHSKLIKNKKLRRRATELQFQIDCQIVDPTGTLKKFEDRDVLFSAEEVSGYLASMASVELIERGVFDELISTIDGAKGLVKPTMRIPDPVPGRKSKGGLADEMESAIMQFDLRQKQGIMGEVTGPQRIRGLAGSGKTVVLAMKAAQALLQNPNARIAYTFSTKSLYQHVKRLITRFYRQFDDRDPDWERSMNVIHGWGGQAVPGLYSIACARHSVRPISLSEASNHTLGDRFEYACNELINKTRIEPFFDYIFVDEAQDFPLPFLKLCHSFAKEGKFVIGYDELQTIFQAKSPDSASIFGVDESGAALGSFEEDVVLHKCYRNPREILVTAHSIGFGIYGKKIVQMLDSADHWEDIGYKVIAGDFSPGTEIRVERPKENSLDALSGVQDFRQIIDVIPCDSMETEILSVSNRIREDINDDLRPEDILVVCVDDRYAKSYLTKIAGQLGAYDIKSNNIHEESFGVRDFSSAGRVTLSTVHKAKGNEAFMVYVVGCDSAMRDPNVKKRNMLFTAITRAKGWVRMSGCWDPSIGGGEFPLQSEFKSAQEHFPQLVFRYPDHEALKVMKRDLAEAADRKMKAERLLALLDEDFSDEEIQNLIKQRARKKKG
jgi:superfamily I DNA and RNA helicase